MKLPALRPKEVEKILFNAGFLIDTTKGSHRTYYNPKTDKHTTVSFHQGTVPMGTLHAIINQTGLTQEKFLSFKKKQSR